MMFIQIEDVHSLFADIEKLRANNWLSSDDKVDGHLKPQVKYYFVFVCYLFHLSNDKKLYI